MDNANAAFSVPDALAVESGAGHPGFWSEEHRRRSQVADVVLGLWTAALRNELGEYLQPIPLTRMYAAQRAFLEIGALDVAHELRRGLFCLKRVGVSKPLSLIAKEMTTLLLATTDDVDQLIDTYTKMGLRKSSSPSLVRARDRHAQRSA